MDIDIPESPPNHETGPKGDGEYHRQYNPWPEWCEVYKKDISRKPTGSSVTNRYRMSELGPGTWDPFIPQCPYQAQTVGRC